MSGDADFNPRFVAYAKAHDKTAAEALAECKARRTGRMMNFILWINAKWSEWKRLNDRDRFCHLSEADHVAFDNWLNVA